MTLPPEDPAIAPMRGGASNPTRNFTARYGDALVFAEDKHRGHVRKDTDIPYVSHLVSVSALVMEHGGDEDEAIAGLLHDVIEDRGGDDPEPLKAEIEARFGARVLGIVLGCSDSTTSVNKPDWETRKRDYIAHLAAAPAEVLRVSCADKLHNARAILGDLEDPNVHVAVFERFTGKRDNTLRYYQSLAEILTSRNAPMARAFDDVVARIHALAGATARRGLE